MPIKDRIIFFLRSPGVIVAAVVLLLVCASASLFAQQKAPPIAPPSSLETATSSDEISLLPLIKKASENTPLPSGVMLRSAPARPGDLPPSPDEFKMLYGYRGRYYNVSNLDGQVTVIQESIYAWPTSTWKASGLVRNQTHSAIHISSLTARLLGAGGTVLATTTVTIPVADLRPGEPGPFMIEAPVASSEVKAVEWHIDSVPAPPQTRPLIVEPDYGPVNVPNEPKYWLIGELRNQATTTLRDVRVVVAWLDDEKRVRYVAAPAFRPFLDRPATVPTIDLPAGGYVFFTYEPREPWLVSLFENTYDLATWGISN